MDSWAQIILSIAVSASVVAWAVSTLFKTMGSSYGAIIAQQQSQLNEQGQKLVDLQAALDAEKLECEKKMADLQRMVRDVKQRLKGNHAE